MARGLRVRRGQPLLRCLMNAKLAYTFKMIILLLNKLCIWNVPGDDVVGLAARSRKVLFWPTLYKDKFVLLSVKKEALFSKVI